MAYNHSLMSELIQKLNSAIQRGADIRGEQDFYLRLIALNAKVFGPHPDDVPLVLTDGERKTILALVREISGENRNAITYLAPSNGKGTR